MATAAPAPILRPRQRQRVETRERLLRAALDEIRRAGVAAAQVDRIVATAGVSRGSFYFHFPTREHVLLEWERRREQEIIGQLHGARRRRQPLREALLQVVTFLAGLMTSTDGGLVLDLLAIHVRSPANLDAYPLLGEIERRLAEARSGGELRRDVDVRQTAILFLSNVFGFLVACSTARPPQPKPQLLVDVFLSGVTAQRGARARPGRPPAGRRR